jgi:flagellar biosynthesis/type III secretory pathway chaperone
VVDGTTTTLADLMAKKRKCLEQLHDLGGRQLELIAGGDATELLRIASAKQQLIVALQMIEKRLAPFHDQPPESRAWASPEARARCAADAEVCRRLMQEVMALEQDGERQVTERRDGVAAQLRMAAQGGRVREAYQANR